MRGCFSGGGGVRGGDGSAEGMTGGSPLSASAGNGGGGVGRRQRSGPTGLKAPVGWRCCWATGPEGQLGWRVRRVRAAGWLRARLRGPVG
jgi:hypothetical protein